MIKTQTKAAQRLAVKSTYNAAGVPTETTQNLAERYLPLVKSIVSKMRMHIPDSMDVEDVYSIGVYGLMSALHNYDPKKGAAFGAYASLRIRGAILDELRRIDWMPRKLRARAKEVNKIKAALEQELGRVPNAIEMAEALDIEEIEYMKLEEKLRPVILVNLDTLFGEDASDSNSLHEVIPDLNEVNAREFAEDKETIELMKKTLYQLPEIPRKVLAMYYFENMRLAEIAEVFELSESRICQIHSKAISQLRTAIMKIQG